jgi:hypothetical protein
VQHKFYGIILILIATFLFAVLDTLSKYLTAFFAVPLIVWARYFVHLVFMLVGIAPGMGREIVVTKRPWLMIFRGLLLVCSSLLAVLAFSTLPLAETTALVFITPLLVALLAGPLLGEKVPLKSWLATIFGFGGVLLIARPGGSMFGIGVVYALGCALSYAGYQTLTRKLLHRANGYNYNVHRHSNVLDRRNTDVEAGPDHHFTGPLRRHRPLPAHSCFPRHHGLRTVAAALRPVDLGHAPRLGRLRPSGGSAHNNRYADHWHIKPEPRPALAARGKTELSRQKSQPESQ